MQNRLADPQRRATCEAVYFAHIASDWSPQDNEMLKAPAKMSIAQLNDQDLDRLRDQFAAYSEGGCD